MCYVILTQIAIECVWYDACAQFWGHLVIKLTSVLSADVYQKSLITTRIFSQVEMPVEETIFAGITVFLFWVLAEQLLYLTGWFPGRVSSSRMPENEAEFPATAASCLCSYSLSGKAKMKDSSGVMLQRPTHLVGGCVILLPSVIQIHSYFFIIKMYMFSSQTNHQYKHICAFTTHSWCLVSG